MIYIKSENDIKNLREGGHISAQIMKYALKMAVPGITTLDLNNKVENMMLELNVFPWFKEVDNYPFGTCISVNDGWVHGMPSDYVLNTGDVVSIDLGIKYKKYYLDHCWTVVVTKKHSEDPTKDVFHENPSTTKFLGVGIDALHAGINKFKNGSPLGNISHAMQSTVENCGYSVIREYTGHGVGIKAHEDPIVPCYGTNGAGQLLKIGMVFAIEVMYAIGDSKIVVASDGWTVSTKDKKISGMYEHTVALTKNGPEILTI